MCSNLIAFFVPIRRISDSSQHEQIQIWPPNRKTIFHCARYDCATKLAHNADRSFHFANMTGLFCDPCPPTVCMTLKVHWSICGFVLGERGCWKPKPLWREPGKVLSMFFPCAIRNPPRALFGLRKSPRVLVCWMDGCTARMDSLKDDNIANHLSKQFWLTANRRDSCAACITTRSYCCLLVWIKVCVCKVRFCLEFRLTLLNINHFAQCDWLPLIQKPVIILLKQH